MKRRSMDEAERIRYLETNGRRDEFLHRENKVVDGFDFDSYLFEDLIDNFTPFEDIPIILRVSYTDLDFWCRRVYNMCFRDAFDFLSRKALYYCRKAYTNLSKAGNNTAIKTVGEHFMKLGQDQQRKQAVIPVLAVMPTTSIDEGESGSGIGVSVGYDEDEDEEDEIDD